MNIERVSQRPMQIVHPELRQVQWCEWCSAEPAEKENLCSPCHVGFVNSDLEGVELTAEDLSDG